MALASCNSVSGRPQLFQLLVLPILQTVKYSIVYKRFPEYFTLYNYTYALISYFRQKVYCVLSYRNVPAMFNFRISVSNTLLCNIIQKRFHIVQLSYLCQLFLTYTVRHTRSITQTLFQRRFSCTNFFRRTTSLYILLPQSFLSLLNISKCHFGHFAKFLRCPVYTNPYFGGMPLNSVTA